MTLCMNEQSHYKQDKTITRQSINFKRHIFNVIGGSEESEERDLNIGGDSEALAAAAVTHDASTQEETNLGSNSSQNKACNYKEFRAVMRENFCGTEEGDRVKFASSTLLDSSLTWWNVYVHFVTLNTAHATPWSDFKAIFIRKQQGCLQLGKVPMLANYLTAESVDDTILTHALLFVTTVEGHDIKSKTAELHLVPQAKEDQEARKDREAMSLILDVVKKDITRTSVRTMEVKAVETKFEATNKILRTIRGRIKETLREITKHQPVLKEDAEHLAE
ncbi:hypothetical protein Tco_0074134 [Tanacetum coccineum]